MVPDVSESVENDGWIEKFQIYVHTEELIRVGFLRPNENATAFR